jgi:NAD(P)-dependent dehydrogenase (short-subunit alcohol dehydrogenase family)
VLARDSQVSGPAAGLITGMACDVASPDDVARLVEAGEDAMGGVDILINNAGTARRDAFLDIGLSDSLHPTTRPSSMARRW